MQPAQQPHGVGSVRIPVVQLTKQKPREVKQLARGLTYTAAKQWGGGELELQVSALWDHATQEGMH